MNTAQVLIKNLREGDEVSILGNIFTVDSVEDRDGEFYRLILTQKPDSSELDDFFSIYLPFWASIPKVVRFPTEVGDRIFNVTTEEGFEHPYLCLARFNSDLSLKPMWYSPFHSYHYLESSITDYSLNP